MKSLPHPKMAFNSLSKPWAVQRFDTRRALLARSLLLIVILNVIGLTFSPNALASACYDLLAKSTQAPLSTSLAARMQSLPIDSSPESTLTRERFYRELPFLVSRTEALKLLLPKARGVTTRTPDELMFARDAIVEIGKLSGSYPVRESSLSPRTSDHEILRHEPIASIKNVGGGFNTTLIVQFVNGRRAIFKPLLGQLNLKPKKPQDWTTKVAFAREATAYTILEDVLENRRARENGQSSILVPETIEALLVHDGVSYGIGSLQIFVEGFESGVEAQAESLANWETLLQSPKAKAIEVRTRVLDYLLGNPDRYPNPGLANAEFAKPNWGNIMIPRDKNAPLRAVLIDNAWGRPGPRDFDERFLPKAHLIPADLAATLLRFDEASFRQRFKDELPEEGIADFVRRVRVVQNLISKPISK